jgi:hypothetical protein
VTSPSAQIEKGPVDCCSHDARYSLSEDRLLREAVIATTVACCVVQVLHSTLFSFTPLYSTLLSFALL